MSAKLQGLSASLLAVTLLLLAFTPNLPSAALALGLAGAFAVVFKVSNESRIQLNVPDALRGRIISVYFFLGSGTAPLSSVLIAGAMGWAGARQGLVIMTILALTFMAILRVVQDVRGASM